MIKISQAEKLNLLKTIFIASMILANVVGVKIMNVGPLTVSVAIWLIPITFLITDIIAEVKGRQYINSLIWTTTIALIFSYLFIQITLMITPADRFVDNEAFTTIFSGSARFFFASIVAFLLAQFHDIWAFEFWKKKTRGRHLWLRNNLSTAASQLIDTSVFMFLAFYKITPRFDVPFVIELIFSYFIFKVILALIDTPFVYAGVKWLREKNDAS